jgi:hypothetical protein
MIGHQIAWRSLSICVKSFLRKGSMKTNPETSLVMGSNLGLAVSNCNLALYFACLPIVSDKLLEHDWLYFDMSAFHRSSKK